MRTDGHESRSPHLDPQTPQTVPGAPERTTLRRRLVPVASWAAALGVVLVVLRPVWATALQGDDFLLIFIINSEDGVGPLATGVREMVRWATVSGIHFNPIAYFVDGALKSAELNATAGPFGASAWHHVVLSALVVAMLPVTAVLVSRLTGLFSARAVRATTLAVPIAVGFAVAAQVSAPWSMYDPLVVHPAFGALPSLIGMAYLSASVAAMPRSAPVRRMVTATALGVAGFLTYEVLMAFVVAVVGVALLASWRGVTIAWRRLAWLVGVPLATFAVSRAIIASHPQQDYQGTALQLGTGTVRAWLTSVATGNPAVLWGLAGRYADLGHATPYALAATAALLVALGGWALVVLRRPAAPAGPGPRRWAATGWTVLVLAATAALSPVPFVVTGMWGHALAVFGTTYMHSLVPMWCWAGVIGLLTATALEVRSRARVALVLVPALALVGGFQINVNRQLAAYQLAHPPLGVDVARIVDSTTVPPVAERCDTLHHLQAHPERDTLTRVLNREYEERHGVPFCPEG